MLSCVLSTNKLCVRERYSEKGTEVHQSLTVELVQYPILLFCFVLRGCGGGIFAAIDYIKCVFVVSEVLEC